MSTTIQASERFTALPDERTLVETVVALEGRGFSVEVVDDLDAAREGVLARIPEGSSVMTNPSVTLRSAGIVQAVDDGARYDSARTKVLALDHATQLQEVKAVMGQPEFALGSVHAITHDGTLVIASALGSQLTAYAWAAANVMFVVGAQKARTRPRRGTRPRLPAQPQARGRPCPQGLRDEESRRQDPRDPRRGSWPHPRRPHPCGRWVLTRASVTFAGWAGCEGARSAETRCCRRTR